MRTRVESSVPRAKSRVKKTDWASMPFDQVKPGQSLVLTPDDPDEITSIVNNGRMRAQDATGAHWSACIIEGEVWLWPR